MRIFVRHLGVAPTALPAERASVMTRRALDWASELVRSVKLVFSDENGPRGGIDQRCTVHITLRSVGRPVVARAVAATPRDALTVALERSARRLGRASTARRLA